MKKLDKLINRLNHSRFKACPLSLYEALNGQVEKYVEEMNAWLDVRVYPILDENGKLSR